MVQVLGMVQGRSSFGFALETAECLRMIGQTISHYRIVD
jgi:hypothetical protein